MTFPIGQWCIIIDLGEGVHQYKFKVDDQWVHNPREETVSDGMGGFNNVIKVEKSDFDVLEALERDSRDVATRKEMMRPINLREEEALRRRRVSSVRGDAAVIADVAAGMAYGQEIPAPEDYEEWRWAAAAAQCAGTADTGGYHSVFGSGTGPPVLPPHLLQVILNKDTPLSCEPTLLPMPNHVLLNHMYALSIKDQVMVMSATTRFRRKFVTTILYRPIDE